MKIVRFVILLSLYAGSTHLSGQNTPDGISGLLFWFSADSGVSVSGGKVTGWQDLSGNSNNASQVVVASQPIWVDSIAELNNKPVIRMDGLNDFMNFNPVQVRTVFFVLKHTTGTGGYNTLLGNSFSYHWHGHLTNLMFNNYAQTANIINGNCYVNGVSKLPINAQKPTEYSIFSLVLAGNHPAERISGDNNNPSPYWKGDFAEIIAYDQPLSNFDLNNLNVYLSQKYAYKVNFTEDTITLSGYCDTLIGVEDLLSGYQWYKDGGVIPGANSNTLIVSSPGVYKLKAADKFGFNTEDSIVIRYPGNMLDSNPVKICLNDSFLWDSELDLSAFSLIWSNGDTTSNLYIASPGAYWYTAQDTNMCAFNSDTLWATVDSFPTYNALNDTLSFCHGDSISFLSGLGNALIPAWDNGDASVFTSVANTGWLGLQLTNVNSCLLEDSIFVEVMGHVPTAIFSSDTVCVGQENSFLSQSFSNDTTNIINSIWVFNGVDTLQGDSVLYISANNLEVSLVIETSANCFGVYQQNILNYPSPDVSIAGLTEYTCINETVNLQGIQNGLDTIASWQWQVIDQNSNDILFNSIGQNAGVSINQMGEFFIVLKATTTNGCFDSINAYYKVYGPDACMGLNGLSIPMIAWFKADSLMVDSTGFITQWTDCSGNYHHAIQSNPLARPILNNAVGMINGASSVKFDGSNDYLSLDSLSPASVFMMVTHQTGSGDYQGILGANTSYRWHGGAGNKLFNSYSTTANIIQGGGFKNSVGILPNVMVKPTNYSHLGLNFANRHPVERIGGDNPSNNPSPYWKGSYCEIILFDDVLDQTQVNIVQNYFRYKYAPPINLGRDVEVPYGFCDTTIGVIYDRFSNYKWYWNGNIIQGAVAPTYNASRSGEYKLVAQDIFGNTTADSINVSFPVIDFIATDTVICIGDTIQWVLNIDPTDYQIQWSTGALASSLSISEPGFYYVKVTDTIGCVDTSNVLTVEVDSFEFKVNLGADTSICGGNVIKLLITNEPYLSYLWSTGSMANSTVITTSGAYSVEVTNQNACYGSDTIQVVVQGNAPTIAFNFQDICDYDSSYFTDFSYTNDGSELAVWNWNFGDGNISTSQNPTYFYDNPGIYMVSLYVETDSGCAEIKSDTIEVYASPGVAFNSLSANFCTGLPLQFNDVTTYGNSGYGYRVWDFGDLNTLQDSSNASIGVYAYQLAGQYPVKLKAINGAGCADSLTTIISLNETPVAHIIGDNSCLEDSLVFIDNTTGTIVSSVWDFGDGQTATGALVSKLYATSGNYQVSLEVVDAFNCQDDTTITIGVFDKPIAGFSAEHACIDIPFQMIDTSNGNGDDILTWQWTVLNSSPVIQSSLQNPIFVFDKQSEYLLALSITTSRGCKDSIYKVISVHQRPEVSIESFPEYGPAPLEVSFSVESNTNIESHSWHFGVLDSSSLASPNYLFLENGVYTVNFVGTDVNGCTAKAIRTIYIQEPFLDLAILEIDPIKTKGEHSYQMAIKLENTGTRPISEFVLAANAQYQLGIIEEWNLDVTMKPSERKVFIFNAQFEMTEENLEGLYCAKIVSVDNQSDDNELNNEKCVVKQPTSAILGVYPNPGVDVVNFDVYLTQENTSCQIFDFMGRVIYQKELNGLFSGFNRITIDLNHLEAGTYLFSISNENGFQERPFVLMD